MSGQKYIRTSFEEDECSAGTMSPVRDAYPSVMFRGSLTAWQKTTILERVLCMLLFACLIAVIILACLLAVKQSSSPLPANATINATANICLTTSCVAVASSILSALNTSVDPCEDFYQYSCGNWIRTHPIPVGHSRWDTFSLMWQTNQIVMKHVLSQPLKSSPSEAEDKAKLYYQSCMDSDKEVERLGSSPMVELMDEFGKWTISNVSGVWNPATWNFQAALESGHRQGLSVFFSMSVGENDKNSSQHILKVDQGGLSLMRDYYMNNQSIADDKVLTAYLEYMTEIGVLLGGEENDTRRQMTEVIEFETELANITIPSYKRRDEEKNYHLMNIEELQKLMPCVQWLHYFNIIGSIANLTFTKEENILVYAPEYLLPLGVLLSDMLSTDNGKRILTNYIMWHLVSLYAPYLSKPFREATNKLKEAISGVQGKDDKWRICATDTDSVLGFALGAMFVREVFHGESKEQAEDMIMQIKTAFINNLPDLSWMDDETRIAAIDKANAVVDMIGFPHYILNSTKLDFLYSKLVIKSNEYFNNNMRKMKFLLLGNIKKLREPPKENSWGMTPPTVNAYYTPTQNEIVFPAGILQAPFYDQNYPRSINFGGMGVVMGHELTHGFDDMGREYDKFGNLRKWWKNSSIEKFNNRSQCIVEQYSQYELGGEKLNGLQTLGENIADNGGLKSAFHAYVRWLRENGQEPNLPGVNLTNKQLFFVGFAQVWCSVSAKAMDHMQIMADSHSPSKFRVIGTLSNSKEFAEQFNCKVGSKMNPEKKCEVW